MGSPSQRAFEEAAVGCVVRCAGDVSLHEMRESPDADLLHQEGFHIGLEVVRTVDQRIPDTKRRLDAATEAIQRDLDSRGIRGHVTVYFDVDEVVSDPSVRLRELPAQLANFLESRSDALAERALLQACGIRGVARIERSPASNTWVYCGMHLRGSGGTLAAITLEKKHERLRYYREQSGNYFRQYWLAIASLGPGTVEDGGFMMLLERTYVTDFDRVFMIFHGPDGRLAMARDITPTGHVTVPST